MQTYTSGKITIKETSQGLLVDIPSPQNWIPFIVLTFCLGCCIFGEILAIEVIIEKGLLIQRLIGVIFGICIGIVIFFGLIKIPIGTEIIELDSRWLTIKRKVFFYTWGRAYRLKYVKNITISDPDHGSLKFQYGFKTIYFAKEADKEDALYLLDFLKPNKVSYA